MTSAFQKLKDWCETEEPEDGAWEAGYEAARRQAKHLAQGFIAEVTKTMQLMLEGQSNTMKKLEDLERAHRKV